MDEVVNGAGTAGRSKLQLEGIRMGGKTGTAQVRRIAGGARGGMNVPWKYRDHGLFIGFAPVDQPRYAAAVVIEHGMSGSGAAAPVASDMMTYLFDREKATAKLATLEEGWGGDIVTRMKAQSDAFVAAQAAPAPPPADVEAETSRVVDRAAAVSGARIQPTPVTVPETE
jgi:penicillin-binding protein 2